MTRLCAAAVQGACSAAAFISECVCCVPPCDCYSTIVNTMREDMNLSVDMVQVENKQPSANAKPMLRTKTKL